MKTKARSITAVWMIVVAAGICLWSVRRPASSVSSITESQQPWAGSVVQRANHFHGASASTEFAAGQGGSSTEEDRTESDVSHDIDVDVTETETAWELSEEEISAALQHLVTQNAASSTLENLTQQWAARNHAAALAWAMDQKAGVTRDRLIQRIAFVQAQSSPADAAWLVVEQIPSGAIQADAAISVLHQWALKDLAAAGAWVQRFPEGALKHRAEQEIQGLQRIE